MQVANIITVYLGHVFPISRRSAENVQKEHDCRGERPCFRAVQCSASIKERSLCNLLLLLAPAVLFPPL